MFLPMRLLVLRRAIHRHTTSGTFLQRNGARSSGGVAVHFGGTFIGRTSTNVVETTSNHDAGFGLGDLIPLQTFRDLGDVMKAIEFGNEFKFGRRLLQNIGEGVVKVLDLMTGHVRHHF